VTDQESGSHSSLALSYDLAAELNSAEILLVQLGLLGRVLEYLLDIYPGDLAALGVLGGRR
jgi:hypothetical protein